MDIDLQQRKGVLRFTEFNQFIAENKNVIKSEGLTPKGSFQLSGTISVTDTTVTGVDTLFTTELKVGDIIYRQTDPFSCGYITSITSDIELEVESAFTESISGVIANGADCNQYLEALTLRKIETMVTDEANTDYILVPDGSGGLYWKINPSGQLIKDYINGGVFNPTQDLFSKMTSYNSPDGEECWVTSDRSDPPRYAGYLAHNKTSINKFDCWEGAGNPSVALPEINLRKMTGSRPITDVRIRSRNDVVVYGPEDFTIVYTTDDMSGYNNVDPNIRNVNFTICKTVTGESWVQSEEKEYNLTTTIPANATAWGIICTKSDGALLAISEINGDCDLNTLKEGVISRLEARSSDNTVDISIPQGDLDIRQSSDWASGIAPNLANLTVAVWADYNNGNPRFIFDDIFGSNISGAKRRLGIFVTDVNENIVPFIAIELISGAVIYIPKTTVTTSLFGNISLPFVPIGVPTIVKVDLQQGAYDVSQREHILTSDTGDIIQCITGGPTDGQISIVNNSGEIITNENKFTRTSDYEGTSTLFVRSFKDERV